MDEFLIDLVGMAPTPDLSERSTFLRNLAFVYQLIIASEDLLREAESKSTASLQAYFSEHLREEAHHAEWLADDLASADIDVRALPISPEAVAMAGSQHYLIRYVDPAALLGYMVVLECFPTPIERVDALERLHGKRLCRTLRYHAVHDKSHGAELRMQIDRLSDWQQELVKQNAVQTMLYLRAAAAKFNGGSHA